jgi:integrase
MGEFFDDSALRNRFYAALRAADLGHLREKDDPITFHDLRHTFGTLGAAVRAGPFRL